MSRSALYEFRLYVAGNTPNSAQARVNLNAFCRKHLNGRYRIEIVDIAQYPNRALTDGIYMTPALLKLSPSPVCMIVGTLSGAEAVLTGLGLPTSGESMNGG